MQKLYIYQALCSFKDDEYISLHLKPQGAWDPMFLYRSASQHAQQRQAMPTTKLCHRRWSKEESCQEKTIHLQNHATQAFHLVFLAAGSTEKKPCYHAKLSTLQ